MYNVTLTGPDGKELLSRELWPGENIPENQKGSIGENFINTNEDDQVDNLAGEFQEVIAEHYKTFSSNEEENDNVSSSLSEEEAGVGAGGS